MKFQKEKNQVDISKLNKEFNKGIKLRILAFVSILTN